MLEQANPIVTCVRRVPDGGWGWAVLTAASLANVLTCGLLKCIRHERERVIALACAHARMCLEQRKSLHVSLCVCLKKKDIIGEIDGVCHNESNN